MVSDFFPPVLGGLEAHVDDLCAELVARGHEVHVATLTADATPSDGRVQVHQVRTMTASLVRFERKDRPFAPPIPDPAARVALTRLVRNVAPDVVHGHSWLAASLPTGRRRPPTVFTAHDYATACQLHTLLRTDGTRCDGPSFAACVACGAQKHGRVKSLALAAGTVAGRRLVPADRVLTLSRMVASVVGPLFVVPTEVVPGFVRARSAVEDVAGLPAGPFVMYAGDPGAHKGLELLLSLWSSPTPPSLPLLVASTKEVEQGLPPGVTVMRLSRDEVRAAWHRAAVAVVPSRWDEPFGMVAIEALTAGVPVIASRVGALPELVRDGADGLLVTPDDEHALGAALDRVLSDDRLRTAMSAAALAGSRRFAADEVIPRIEAVYERAIRERREAA